MAHYFPALDPKLLSVLLDGGQDSPCIIWNAPPHEAPALFGGFQVIVQAIIRHRRIHFLHQGHTQSAVAPYRLICLDGKWYLVAVSKERIQVFTLSSITDVVMTVSGFVRNSHTSRIFQDPRFIRKRTAITVLTNGGYLVGSTMRHGSSSLTRFTGQSAMTSRIW